LTIVILVFLVVLWVVVLGPTVLRSRAARRKNAVGSVGTFHRQLRILGRSGGPAIVEPVHRLGAVQTPTVVPVNGSGLPVITSHGGLTLLEDRATELRVAPERPDRGASKADPSSGPSPERPSDPYFRSSACKRRRDVLLGLVTVVVTTGLLGALPPLRLALVLTGVCALALVVYVALLVYLRNLAVERQMKLRYLPQHGESAPLPTRRVASR
jgi:hypothetical protein